MTTATHPRHKSHLTAIARKTLPVPTRWLLVGGHPQSDFRPDMNILDFGCGRCHEINNRHFRCDGYDPYYRPEKPPKGKRYQVIICNYVLCILPPKERLPVLRQIQALLSGDGTAYISVRNDKPKQGWGISSRKTYQGRVRNLSLPLFYKNSQFRMYIMTKYTDLTTTFPNTDYDCLH